MNMLDDLDELSKKNNKAFYIKLLNNMQRIQYDIEPLSEETLLDLAAKHIPIISKFLQSVGSSGSALIQAGEQVKLIQPTPLVQSATSGFQFAALILAIGDFIRIPIIYLISFILNKEVPFNLTNNAAWAYSAVLLTLAVIALAVPTAAPVIAFVGAGISLAVSVFTLTMVLVKNYQLNSEMKQIRKELQHEENEMALIQEEAARLESVLKETKEEDLDEDIYLEIKVLEERFKNQKKVIEDLKNKEFHLGQEIKQVGLMKIIDRGLGVGLAALSLVGLVVAVFNPPVGLGIIAGSAVFGTSYLVVRVATPLLVSLLSWMISSVKPVDGAAKKEEELLDHDLKNKLNQKDQGLTSSSEDILKKKNIMDSELDIEMSSLKILRMLDEDKDVKFDKIKLDDAPPITPNLKVDDEDEENREENEGELNKDKKLEY